MTDLQTQLDSALSREQDLLRRFDLLKAQSVNSAIERDAWRTLADRRLTILQHAKGIITDLQKTLGLTAAEIQIDHLLREATKPAAERDELTKLLDGD